jgi:hypothetical protein
MLSDNSLEQHAQRNQAGPPRSMDEGWVPECPRSIQPEFPRTCAESSAEHGPLYLQVQVNALPECNEEAAGAQERPLLQEFPSSTRWSCCETS